MPFCRNFQKMLKIMQKIRHSEMDTHMFSTYLDIGVGHRSFDIWIHTSLLIKMAFSATKLQKITTGGITRDKNAVPGFPGAIPGRGNHRKGAFRVNPGQYFHGLQPLDMTISNFSAQLRVLFKLH